MAEKPWQAGLAIGIGAGGFVAAVPAFTGPDLDPVTVWLVGWIATAVYSAILVAWAADKFRGEREEENDG
jgi:hypothetical protein